MNELDSLLTTVNGVPARCVAIDPKGKKAAVGSEYVVFSHSWTCEEDSTLFTFPKSVIFLLKLLIWMIL